MTNLPRSLSSSISEALLKLDRLLLKSWSNWSPPNPPRVEQPRFSWKQVTNNFVLFLWLSYHFHQRLDLIFSICQEISTVDSVTKSLNHYIAKYFFIFASFLKCPNLILNNPLSIWWKMQIPNWPKCGNPNKNYFRIGKCLNLFKTESILELWVQFGKADYWNVVEMQALGAVWARCSKWPSEPLIM